MNRQKLLAGVSMAGGIAVILIGIAHTAFTPTVYKGFSTLIPDKAAGGAYFFGVMGIFVIFAGWLMIYSATGLRRAEAWAWMVAFTNALCNLVAGIGAMVAGFRHSLVLTWVAVSLGISVLATIFHRDFRKPLLPAGDPGHAS